MRECGQQRIVRPSDEVVGQRFSDATTSAHLRSEPHRRAAGEPPPLDWCPVPAGTVACRDGCRIVVEAFEITRTPVTRGQYLRFVESGGYVDERWWTVHGWRHRRSFGWSGQAVAEGDPTEPVTGVSWWEAMAFAWWAGSALPGEAQWRHAARASAVRAGSAVAAGGRLRDTDRPPAAPDLAGHVAEWCLDNPRVRCPGAGAVVAPVHETAEVAAHVVHGGFGGHDGTTSHCNGLEAYAPELRDQLIGFRLVR